MQWTHGRGTVNMISMVARCQIETVARDDAVTNTSKSISERKNIEALCAAKGMRMTEQRRVIARVLAESDDHPDVEELYRRCAKVDDRISISTVYRTVRLFEDAGIIERHDFRDGRARYETSPRGASRSSDQSAQRGSDRIPVGGDRAPAGRSRAQARLRLVDHRLELYAVPLSDDKKR